MVVDILSVAPYRRDGIRDLCGEPCQELLAPGATFATLTLLYSLVDNVKFFFFPPVLTLGVYGSMPQKLMGLREGGWMDGWMWLWPSCGALDVQVTDIDISYQSTDPFVTYQ